MINYGYTTRIVEIEGTGHNKEVRQSLEENIGDEIADASGYGAKRLKFVLPVDGGFLLIFEDIGHV